MIIKNISKVIQETLKARERALARKTKYALQGETAGTLDISDMASRTTFVRMISNKETPVIIQGGKLGDSGTTLFGFNQSVQKGDALYWDYDNEGIKPKPGIKDISVEYKGGYKAIRQATINWSVNSIKDLDRLTPHFLTIGKTMLLEWGWIMKGKMISSFYDEWNEEILDEAFSNPMPRIIENEGNYDAMAGVISNFGYDLNESGGFDCVTTMVSMGTNLFEGQKADSDGADVKIIPKEDGTNSEPKINNDGLVNAIINLDRIIFHQYFEVPFSDAYGPRFSLHYANKLDYDKDKNQILSHYVEAVDGKNTSGFFFGFSTKKREGWSADKDTETTPDTETIRTANLHSDDETAIKSGLGPSQLPDRSGDKDDARAEVVTVSSPNADALTT